MQGSATEKETEVSFSRTRRAFRDFTRDSETRRAISHDVRSYFCPFVRTGRKSAVSSARNDERDGIAEGPSSGVPSANPAIVSVAAAFPAIRSGPSEVSGDRRSR